jgi:tRNA(Ile)-lysidine synthase
MAASPTPKPTPNSPNPALAALEVHLARARTPAFAPDLNIGIAYSGGADSTALLLAAAARWPGRIQAIHIHHGLQVAAEAFVRNCETLCASLGVPLQVIHVNAAHASGESPEDAARRARYSALAAESQRLGLAAVLLGQHADDQVETLLLALSRGAGLPGLSAMGANFERHGVWFHRPLLETPAAALRGWLLEQGVAFVDDPSNSDERYTRNRIRAGLLPALEATFPQFRETFARSARHAAEAQALLVELARADLAGCGAPPRIASLRGLSAPRQANLLRLWLLEAHRATPSAAQLEQLLSQIAACSTRGHRIHLKVADGHVTRDGDLLAYAAPDKPG